MHATEVMERPASRAHSSQARDLRFSVDQGARSSGRPPPVVCNHGRRLVWHWHQSSCYTFPSAARFNLSPISLALSLSETALLHLHHPACALRRAAYRCPSCQIPAAKLPQALRARPNCFRCALPTITLRCSLLALNWYVLCTARCCCSRPARFCRTPAIPRPAEPSLARQSRLLACAPEQVRSSVRRQRRATELLPSPCIPCSPQPKGSASAS
jgi:hypothetical protein